MHLNTFKIRDVNTKGVTQLPNALTHKHLQTATNNIIHTIRLIRRTFISSVNTLELICFLRLGLVEVEKTILAVDVLPMRKHF